MAVETQKRNPKKQEGRNQRGTKSYEQVKGGRYGQKKNTMGSANEAVHGVHAAGQQTKILGRQSVVAEHATRKGKMNDRTRKRKSKGEGRRTRT